MKSVILDHPDSLTEKMFKEHGWNIVDKMEDADLVCFVGGADVSPLLYNAMKHPKTFTDEKMDYRSVEMYHTSGHRPCVGICRGAQFLNVMNGGELFQHVDGHRLGSGFHKVRDCMDGKEYYMTSDHHQMMIPNDDELHEIILYAEESTQREREFDGVNDREYAHIKDIECVFYMDTSSLCFQPHPEWVGKDHECREYFFLILDQYCGE